MRFIERLLCCVLHNKVTGRAQRSSLGNDEGPTTFGSGEGRFGERERSGARSFNSCLHPPSWRAILAMGIGKAWVRLTIELSPEESIALRRFHAANQPPTLEEAAALALREFLIGTGDLELVPALEEDSQVEGTA